jgi:hypothetical protein
MADVDLVDALVRMNSHLYVPGNSDASLATAVQAEVDALVADAAANGTALPAKLVTPAVGVDGGLVTRPIDAMLRLARATRPLISDDVYDWYRHWGWLRYLGIFDWRSAGVLGLSAAGLGVRANQRRVMSEDLGVGFGCVVADLWCARLGAAGPTAIVDMDLALNEGRRWLQRHGANPAVGDRQPDYLLIYPGPTSTRAFAYKALECKGTVSLANVNGQLGRAVTQLASLELSGMTPQGIAVSTVSNGSGVQYFAVDPADYGAIEVVTLTDRDLARARQPGEVRRSVDGTIEIDAGEFIAISLLMNAGTLADYGGNNEAATEFLPPPTLSRLSRRPRDRVVRETAEGTFRGVEYRFPAPDGTPLRVFMGVAAPVDDALASGDIDEVTGAQLSFRAERQESLTTGGSDLVSATSDDGAILLLQA